MTSEKTELEKEQEAKAKAANSPATIRLLKDGEVGGKNASRRRGRMFMIAEPIRKLFIPGGITSDMGKGRLSDDTCRMAMTFSQGTYVDLTGKRREHRWQITVENIDHKSEGDCPACGGEMETEILDDNKRRVACNGDDCDYELSSFCGVEEPE